MSERVNTRLVHREHAVHVKNTRTREGNVEMAKTLTYFAINAGKPAVGVEASKSLPTHERVYYHLNMVEAYLDELGVRYERRFALTPESVRSEVDDNVKVAFYDRRLFLDMAGARSSLGYVPLKKGEALRYEASSPLVAIEPAGDSFRVSYGNRRVTRLHPQFFEYDDAVSQVRLEVDGDERVAAVGSVVPVRERFTVHVAEGVRVNVIGWTRPGVRSEDGLEIRRRDILSRYSVDTAESVFRVELYRGKRFVGMLLVRFLDGGPALSEGAGARPRRWRRWNSVFAAVRRWSSRARRATCARPWQRSRTVAVSCCRAVTARRASPSSMPTTSATPSACCCRWRWCSPSVRRVRS